MPENNGNQNPEKSYTNKYQKHIACSYGYQLVCVSYDKFSKPCKTYLVEDVLTMSLIILSKKVNIAMRWWNNILTKNLRWLKKIIKIVRTLLNVGSVTIIPVIFHNPKN